MRKKNLLYVSLLLVAVLILSCGCQGNANTLSEPTCTIAQATNGVEEEGTPQQPHNESSFLDMITFVNTVDENVFENGAFKNVVEMIKEDGYILQPYYDNEAANIALRNERQSLCLAPSYNGVSEELFAWYRSTVEGREYHFYVGVYYLKSEYLDEYAEHGSGGAYYAQGDAYEEKVNTQLFRSARDYIKAEVCGEERNVILIKGSEGGYDSAEFQYDDFGINVRFYTSDGGYSIEEAKDLLGKISLEKVYLGQ